MGNGDITSGVGTRMTSPDAVLVVGASAAGLSTAEALRRRNYTGRITVLGDEVHAPYDRPPLSKQVLSGAWESGRAALRTDEALSSLDADFILGDSAVGLDPATRTVRTAAGRDLQADAIVIATGVRPRVLPGTEWLGGVHVLRSLEDTIALRSDLLTATRLVVVGEGVLGSEIAATARALGVDVTMTGPQPAPMVLQVGPMVSELLAELHQDNGVRLRLGVSVVGLTEAGGRVTGVRLATDEVLPADVVVVAIGAIPTTDWLTDSGLRLDNGVVCDSRCRAADGIYAVGDVARWHHEQLGELVRLENRTNATEQGFAVAGAIVGEDEPYVPVPYFWSDQFDVKIQVHGALPADAEVDIVDGDLSARRFVARYRKEGIVTGILGWNMPKQSRLRRQEVVDDLAAAVRVASMT
ncbi:NAD(P)/FAD-dependent oxidoreductase [Rhodococcus sp. ACS1]|uniref:NAD(P)/FAD-dependent oxidoreductase n=1 Tax=Rhodococcus sp. ACS1 TaxID=2028570 RepID=UPI00211C652B|nr:FAD-dependent oxidoreductase [Rhodococcus sp. ACS1]